MRKTFPKVTESLMKKNKKVFCLLGDIGVFSFRNVFKNYKNRIFTYFTCIHKKYFSKTIIKILCYIIN